MINTRVWDYVIGMIKLDGLKPTEEFKKYIEKEKRGEVTMEDIQQYLEKNKVKKDKPMRNIYSYEGCGVLKVY